MLQKAELVRQISLVIAQRGMTTAQAAGTLGVTRPTLSDLIRGRLSRFSLERLNGFAERLDLPVADGGAQRERDCT